MLRHKAELRNRRSLNLHITIARMRKPITIPRDLMPPSVTFVLDRLILYQSILGDGQTRYEPITQSRPADSG